MSTRLLPGRKTHRYSELLSVTIIRVFLCAILSLLCTPALAMKTGPTITLINDIAIHRPYGHSQLELSATYRYYSQQNKHWPSKQERIVSHVQKKHIDWTRFSEFALLSLHIDAQTVDNSRKKQHYRAGESCATSLLEKIKTTTSPLRVHVTTGFEQRGQQHVPVTVCIAE